MRIASIILFLGLLLSGCSIYKMNIRQGNIVEQKDVDQLKPGMTKAQVTYLLGRPIVNDSFDENTWYYLNHFKNGKTEEVTRKELLVLFSNEKLSGLKGDYTLPTGFGQ